LIEEHNKVTWDGGAQICNPLLKILSCQKNQ